MALNLLDNLSSTLAPKENNSFSLKTKETKGDAAADFSQMLSQLIDQHPTEGVDVSISSEGTLPSKERRSGTKVATSTEASADALATGVGGTPSSGTSAPLPAPPPLTAIVLSPNMTAITPTQDTPDANSLVAFAQSQGLDKHVAAWLMNAGQTVATGASKASAPVTAAAQDAITTPGTTTAQDATTTLGTTTARDATTTPDNTATKESARINDPMNANAALLASLLASPATGAASPKVTLPIATEQATSPIPLMPMAPPAAWLMQRSAATGKSSTAPLISSAAGSSAPQVHSSELDLTLVFATGKDTGKATSAADIPFTPAAWVMAGLDSSTSPSAMSTAKLTSETTLNDDDAIQPSGVGGIGLGTTKANDPLANGPLTNTKSSETGMSTAERSELHQAQAEKMGQAIGQRMISEMEKGHWHLKMMLKPANLGDIAVEMRLRNGELDANFTASQAMTRDLLQDGLPKLKDTLTQMGMDVASMQIGGGSSQKNGGEPTPQQPHTGNSMAKSDPQDEPLKAQSPQHATSTDQDGLDVLV